MKMAKTSTQFKGDDNLATRKLAIEILLDIRKTGQDATLVLNRALRESPLSQRDRSFVTLLVMQTLRYANVADAVLANFLKQPIDEGKAAFVQMVLRLGVVQLLWLKTSPHAAVHSAVELAKTSRFKAFAGLVNAVLKKISHQGEGLLDGLDMPKLALPDWLWQRWEAAYGQDTTRAIATQLLQDPPLDVSVKGDVKDWAETLDADILPTGSLRCGHSGSVMEMPGFGEGAWWVQDAAAALPAKLLGEDLHGRQALDLCAAPGGKTLQLAARGAVVIAVDRSSRRLKQVRENLQRTGLEAQIIEADILKWQPDGTFDAILLDAPCTATGTIRRQPDVLASKAVSDVHELAALQRQMIIRAGKWLKPGGRLVYCVCSLEKEEGEAHISPVLEACSDLTLEAVTPEEIGGLDEAVTAEGALRTLPHFWAEKGGMDGFFAVRFRKA